MVWLGVLVTILLALMLLLLIALIWGDIFGRWRANEAEHLGSGGARRA